MQFSEWFNERAPELYLKQSRIFCLSKSMGTAYPEHGKIRTISILSIVTKLYELVLQQKL